MGQVCVSAKSITPSNPTILAALQRCMGQLCMGLSVVGLQLVHMRVMRAGGWPASGLHTLPIYCGMVVGSKAEEEVCVSAKSITPNNP